MDGAIVEKNTQMRLQDLFAFLCVCQPEVIVNYSFFFAVCRVGKVVYSGRGLILFIVPICMRLGRSLSSPLLKQQVGFSLHFTVRDNKEIHTDVYSLFMMAKLKTVKHFKQYMFKGAPAALGNRD